MYYHNKQQETPLVIQSRNIVLFPRPLDPVLHPDLRFSPLRLQLVNGLLQLSLAD